MQQNSGLPIPVDRIVSFKTDVGVLSDLDLSSDGQRIYFTMLGDIYWIPATGGVAKQITFGMPIYSKISVSPNGRYIACICDASGIMRLTLLTISGKVLQTFESLLYDYAPYTKWWRTSYHPTPVWAGDNSYIDLGIDRFYLSGGKTVLPNESSEVLGYSAAGRFIFKKSRLNDSVSKISRIEKVGRREETTTVSSKVAYLKNSPDGNLMCYQTPDQNLILYDFSTKQHKRIFDYAGDRRISGNIKFVFSNDLKHLIVSSGGKIHMIDLTSGNGKLIPFEANVKVGIGKFNDNRFRVSLDSFTVRYIRGAQKSPDGKQIVFSALNKIYVKPVAGGKPKELASQDCNQFHPSWSPDGKWIAYTSWTDTEGGYLWRVSANGGEPEQLTFIPARYSYPSWSSDGNSIAVVEGIKRLTNRDDLGSGKIIVVKPDTKSVQVIAQNVPLVDNQPTFSADNSSIIYKPSLNKRTGKYFNILVSQKIGDTSVRILAVSTFRPDRIMLRYVNLSTDERYLSFSYCEYFHLTPVSRGQPVVLLDSTSVLPVVRISEGGFDPRWNPKTNQLNWSCGDKYYEVDPDEVMKDVAKQRTTGGISLIHEHNFPASLIARSSAIGLKAAAGYGQGVIVFQNARIITMNGDQVLENGDIVVKNGRIESVRKYAQFNVSKGAEVIDCSGKTIMPGIIDMHDHMRVSTTILPQQEPVYLLNLAHGVTTARDPSGAPDHFGAEELLRAGKTIGPRLFQVGSAVRDEFNITDYKAAELCVQSRAMQGGTVVKQYWLFSRLQRQWLQKACIKQGLNMTNESQKDFIGYLGQIKDGSTGIEHMPELEGYYQQVGDTVTISKEIIEFFARNKTVITPTFQPGRDRFDEIGDYFLSSFKDVYQQKYERFHPYSLQEPRKDTLKAKSLLNMKIVAALKKGGANVALGSHGDDPGIGVHFEMWSFQMGGLSNLETLHIATIEGAKALGMQQDLGSIENGKIADLIILDKNPLEDIHNTTSIHYVMKAGVLYDGNNLDEIWPEKKKCPEWRMNDKKINISK